jgi:hypothetical protein
VESRDVVARLICIADVDAGGKERTARKASMNLVRELISPTVPGHADVCSPGERASPFAGSFGRTRRLLLRVGFRAGGPLLVLRQKASAFAVASRAIAPKG